MRHGSKLRGWGSAVVSLIEVKLFLRFLRLLSFIIRFPQMSFQFFHAFISSIVFISGMGEDYDKAISELNSLPGHRINELISFGKPSQNSVDVIELVFLAQNDRDPANYEEAKKYVRNFQALKKKASSITPQNFNKESWLRVKNIIEAKELTTEKLKTQSFAGFKLLAWLILCSKEFIREQ